MSFCSMNLRAMRLLRSESGVAMVEFALFLPILAFLFVGIVDYALEIQQALQIQEAASAGAAYGAIPGNQKSFAGNADGGPERGFRRERFQRHCL